MRRGGMMGKEARKWGGRSTGWMNYKAMQNDISTGGSKEGGVPGKEGSMHSGFTS